MEKIWLSNYPKDIPFEIDPDQYQSIPHLFEETCKKYKDRAAFINMGTEISFEELDFLSRDFASFLIHRAGFQKGDRLAIQLPNLLQYPVVLFGALRAGVTVVNTNPLYTEREMKHQFQDSDVKGIVILANFADKLEAILPETNIETVITTEIGDLLGFPKSVITNLAVKYLKRMVPSYNIPNAYGFYEALDLGGQHLFQGPEIFADDLAFLQYTGGTTGAAKGAMLTHRNIVANLLQIGSWISPILEDGNEDLLTPLPLYHIFSLTANCLALFSYGATNILITNPRDMPQFIKTMKSQRFTVITGVNTLFNGLLHQPEFKTIDFSNLKVSVAGGMALQKTVSEKWKKATGTSVIEGYGLTETSPVVCVNPIDGEEKAGSIGMPLPSTDIRLIDEDGKELGVGETGELCVKGPQVMKGYWNRLDETAEIFTSEGWLRTGDVATIDETGFVSIVDRKKDMILVSGFNVYPNEVEDVLTAHDQILEAAAIGLDDDSSGEVVKTFIVRKDNSLSEDDVIAFARKNLTSYKVPKLVEFREELPKSNVGKILRKDLRNEEN